PQVRRPPSQELEDVAPPAAAPAVAQAAPEVVQARTQADTPEKERPASPSPEKPPPARIAAAPEKPPPARIAAATARPPEKQEPRARAPARPSAPVASARPAEPEREPVASARRVAPSRAQESQEERARAVEPRVERSPRTPPPPPPAPEPRKELPPDHPENFDDALDKAFERELGFADTSPRPKRRANEDRTVWVPPSIGQKSLPDSLSQSDIMAVVVAHKEAIASCIRRYSPPTPASGKGRFVVRWRVHPGGNLSDVAVETDSLKATPFARCIEGEIRSWTFPEHRVQRREPIRFPFTY
ncbi:MAG TPA: AgmX/PglI C-terminal domain-containing protein, partial [Myxococcaceae bacterium]|nr:AgmX/PglI C-terminal domain-containing protein [Myxococcaceae bacterium]